MPAKLKAPNAEPPPPLPVTALPRVAPGTRPLVRQILEAAAELRAASPSALQNQSQQLRHQLALTQQPSEHLVTVFALAVAAIEQIRGFQLHPCQISGAIVLAQGRVAEMATGEGKTLTAVLPAMLWGLLGHGVHVVTTNDYLAQRDADELRPIYQRLGLTVGCITQSLEPEARRQAYSRDVTYATASEIGFDFLRDRMTLGPIAASSTPTRYADPTTPDAQLVQRPLFAAIVDEADSVLIDDARTPLIIGVEAPQSTAMISLFRWCRTIVHTLRLDADYTVFGNRKQVLLTDQGARKVLLGSKPKFGQGLSSETLLEHVERMLEACLFFQRDQHYAVQDEEILLIDESTNRPLPGRKLQRGLHHCLEAKEGLPISAGTDTGAKISVQSFFRRYRWLSGMTGTAWNARREFRKAYRLRVQQIPTHRPCIRHGQPPRVFRDRVAKYQAIVTEVVRLRAAGRAVLIGTPSIEASLQLSQFLQTASVPHQVLNAFHEAEEAEIIAQAGQPGGVTIATNMAGRGTDIKLADSVRQAGGLHVIVTEMNSSGRVDRQLIGRAARQGDPGSYQLLLSLEDDLFATLPTDVVKRWQNTARPDRHGELPARWIRPFHTTQQRSEKRHRKDRLRTLKAEKKQREQLDRVGLCPFLEATSE